MTMHPAPKFGAIMIGDEILSGRREDVHLRRLIETLDKRGLQLSRAEFVGDDDAQITETLRRSMSTPDIVFCFGGIGATPDDRTRQAAAAAAGRPLERHAGAVAEIEAQFGEKAYPKRILMADLPQGAALIPNPVNRVPGFSMGTHYFMPGFPQMAWPMTDWVLDTHYAHLLHQRDHAEQAILVLDGIESQLIDLMNRLLERYPGVRIFSLPKLEPQRTIELGIKGPTAIVDAAMKELCEGVSGAGFQWLELN
ncbi:MAG: molybdopterin-binding protein [Methyloligellaceae bacterium]